MEEKIKTEEQPVESSANQQTSPPVSDVPKEKPKLNLPIIIAAVVLLTFVLISVAYSLRLISPNANVSQMYIDKCIGDDCMSPAITSTLIQTSDWKTYDNQKYGYTIQYPSDKFIECSNGDNFELYKGKLCTAGEGLPNISISITDKSLELAETLKHPECWTTKQDKIQIGKSFGTKYTNIRSDKTSCNTNEIAYARQNHIVIDENGIMLRINTSDYANDKLKLTSDIDKILSTFRTTTPADPRENINLNDYVIYKAPAGWKVDKSENLGEYGISLKIQSPDYKLNYDSSLSGMFIIINRKDLPAGKDLKAVCDDSEISVWGGYDLKNTTLDGIPAITSYHNSDGSGRSYSYCLIKDKYIWGLRFSSGKDEAKYQATKDEFINSFRFK